MRNIFLGLPAYNEETSITPLFKEISTIRDRLNTQEIHLSIIFFNDGSTDETSKKCERVASKLGLDVSNIGFRDNQGLDVAVLEIMRFFLQKSKDDDCLVIMDCDNTHQAVQILELYEKFKSGDDIVIASRYIEGASIQGLSIVRRFLSVAARYYFSALFPRSGVRDFTCGFRLYTRNAVAYIEERVGARFTFSGFSCMTEILILGLIKGMKVSSIPLHLRYDRKNSESKMKVIGNAFQLIKLGLYLRFTSTYRKI